MPGLDSPIADPAPLRRAEIARAIPRGSRRARQMQWLEALARDPELGELRLDRRRHIRTVARILARRASWRDSSTRPVIWCATCRSGGDCRGLRPRHAWCVVRAAGVALATVKRCRAWLEARGYLGLVRGGRTPWLRPGALHDDDEPNEAAVYVLAIPRSKTDRRPASSQLRPSIEPLSPSDRTVVKVPAHARNGQGQELNPDSARAETHFLEALARVARISAGESVTDGWIGYIVRPFLAAGWAWRDLSFALDHDPGGAPYTTTLKTVRSPRAWLAWRLSQWIGADGRIMASAAEQRAIAAHRIRAEQQARRAELERARAGWTDPAPHAAALRARMGWGKA